MNLRQQLVSKSAILFAVRICGAGTIFLAQAAIARFFGAAALGDYLIAIAAINLLAIVLPLGLQTVGSIFSAEYSARGNGKQLRQFAITAYGLILFPGVLIAMLAGNALPHFGETGEHLAPLWWPICIMSFGSAVFFVNSSILVGLKQPFLGYFADTICRPLLIVAALAATIAMFDQGNVVLSILWILAISYCVIIAIQFVLTIKRVLSAPTSIDEKQPIEIRRWFYFAAPWLLITLATDFFFDADLIMLTAYLTKEQIAVFGVCTRVFMLASYGITAVYAVILPGIMEDSVSENVAGLSDKINDTNLVAVGLAIILTVTMALLSPLLLFIFGDRFSTGYAPLLILCGSMIVRAVFGPGPLILSSKNRPYASLPAVAGGLIMLVAANYVLVPAMGVTGAALAAVISYFAASVVVWQTTKKITGIDVSVFPALARLVRSRRAG